MGKAKALGREPSLAAAITEKTSCLQLVMCLEEIDLESQSVTEIRRIPLASSPWLTKATLQHWKQMCQVLLNSELQVKLQDKLLWSAMDAQVGFMHTKAE